MKASWKFLILAAAALTFVTIGYSHDGEHGPDFRARLAGSEEVPPVETDTEGVARVKFNDDETVADFRLGLRNGVRVTQAHIHCAPAGTNGPIVVFLAGFHDRGWDVNGWWIRNASVTDANVIPVNTDDSNQNASCPNAIGDLRDLARAMREGNTYVNAHSVAHPAGEVRGQLQQHGPF